jgi:C1A family cysteine protease
MTHRYTWKPDLPDHRDHIFAGARRWLGLRPAKLPLRVNLVDQCPPVFDQGSIGSCTANALCGAMGFLHPGFTGSRLFVYYNERDIEGTIKQDAGAQIRDGVKVLNKLGAAPEKDWPYKVTKFADRPPLIAYTDALAHTITSYQRITNFDDMLACLAAGFPFVFGFTCYEGFESDEVARTGMLQMPVEGETVVGGHAVLAIGYDMHTQRLLVRNSWGNRWGNKGNFTMPFAYVKSRSLSDDFWTLRK